MKQMDEISSTEKLLDVIRGDASSDQKLTPPPLSPKGKLFAFDLKAPISIGVEIEDNELRLVKIRTKRLASANGEWLDFQRTAFSSDLFMDSQKFSVFLKNELKRFCSGIRNPRIWCVMPSSSVDIRYLKIPKVARNQTGNAVYWSYKKEVPFEDKDTFFNYQTIGETTENGAVKIEAIAYTAPQKEINSLKQVFHDAGLHLTGIVPLSFGLQSLLNSQWNDAPLDCRCSLWIGVEWSSIDIFFEGKLVLSRGVRAGINSMAEAIKDELLSDAEIPAEGLKMEGADAPDAADEPEDAEKLALAKQILFNVIYPDTRVPSEISFTEIEVYQKIRPVLQRLVKQVERTLKHFSLHFNNEIVQKLYISGPLAGYEHLKDYLKRQLEVSVYAVNPYDNGKSRSQISALPKPSEQPLYSVSVGAAFSTALLTPNLLISMDDKTRMEQARRINMTGFMVFICLMGIFAGLGVNHQYQIKAKQAQVARLEETLSHYNPCVDQDLIMKQVTRIKGIEKALAAHSAKMVPMAIVGALADLTPDNIRLVSISSDLSDNKDEKGKKSSKTMVMDGVVYGSRQFLETTLAAYVIRLRESMLFGDFKIKGQNYETLRGQEVLRFNGELAIESI